MIGLLKSVQDEVREYFTFHFDPVGSTSRNMITWKPNRNTGFDLDYNITINRCGKKYKPSEIHRIFFNAFRKHMGKYNFSKIEESTSVITIKVVDRVNSKIEHSCDFAIVHRCDDGRIKYIKNDKKKKVINWEYRDKEYDIDDKLNWVEKNGLKNKLRDIYLNYKNKNDKNKKSRTIFAETVNDLYNKCYK